MKFSILLALILASPFVFAWGQYGHEQVNSAAINSLDTGTSLGKCFRAARTTIIRYAITPDIEWKTDLQMASIQGESSTQRKQNDCYEHPLHFFEADSFIQQPGGSIATLPVESDYAGKGFAAYLKLLKMKENSDYVVLVDPTKKLKDPANPTVLEVVIHGTAPWRAAQLYDLAVKAMQKGQFKLAGFYLATMGHYIGDMSQPFHATLNFDGGYRPEDDRAGIHHEIDTGLFERLAERVTKDQNDVYTSFSATERTVQDAAAQEMKKYPARLTINDIVPSVIKNLVATGYPFVEDLLAVYKKQCDIANGKAAKNKSAGKGRAIAQQQAKDRTEKNGSHGAVPVFPTDDRAAQSQIQSKPFCETIDNGGRGEVRAIGTEKEDQMNLAKIGSDSVAMILENRVGASAALLAKLWTSAYLDADQPDFGDCSDWSFDQNFAIMNYPTPNYYPAGFNGITKACAGPQTQTKSRSQKSL